MATTRTKEEGFEESLKDIKKSENSLVAIKKAFLHLRMEASLKCHHHVEKAARLTKEISAVEKKTEEKKEEENLAQTLFDLAILKAKTEYGYYQDFAVLRLKNATGVINVAIHDAIEKGLKAGIEINWQDNLFLFQAACFFEENIAVILSFCERALKNIQSLAHYELRGALLAYIAGELNYLRNEFSHESKEIPEGKEEKQEKPDWLTNINSLIYQCCSFHFNEIKFIVANEAASYSLHEIAEKKENAETFCLSTLPHYKKYSSYLRIRQSIKTPSSQEDLDDAKSDLLSLAHFSAYPLALNDLFHQKPSLILAIRGFFNEESSIKMRVKYKKYIERCIFWRDSKKQEFLGVIRQLDLASPILFTGTNVDAGIKYLMTQVVQNTSYAYSMSIDEMWSIYQGLHSEQFQQKIQVTTGGLDAAKAHIEQMFKMSVLPTPINNTPRCLTTILYKDLFPRGPVLADYSPSSSPRSSRSMIST